MIEFKAYHKYSNDRPELMVHATETETQEGRLAIIFCEKWGMVSAIDDGEDSSGRAKLLLMSPQQVVDRAVSMAGLLMQELRNKGWIIALPTIAEMEKTVAAEKKVG